MISISAFGEANTEQSSELLSRIDEVNKDLGTVLEENSSIVIQHYEQQPEAEHIVYAAKDGVYIQTSSLGRSRRGNIRKRF